jgi:hypothetical protein
LNKVDLAVGAWVLAWIGLAVAIGIELSNLSDLSHTAVKSGQAVETVGRSLGILGAVPLVGGSLSGIASQVQAAGASAVASGHSSLSSINTLAVLLAIAVALLPSIPVLGFYLPLRLERRRAAQALYHTTVRYGGEPGFKTFLAQRAIGSLSYRRLSGLAARPWDPRLSEADREELATAELLRVGIDPVLLDRTAGASAQTSSGGATPPG